MRVLFYEPNPSGHHFAYFARMLPGFIDLPIEIGFATTTAALESPEFEATLAPFADRMELLAVCRPLIKGNPLQNGWRRCRDLAAASRSWKPDHICILYADGIWELAALARTCGYRLLGDGPVMEAWMYRGGFAYPGADGVNDRARRKLFHRFLKQGLFTKIHFDDELLLKFVESLPETKTEVVLPANPVQFREPISTANARAALGIAGDGPIISSSGCIARYKGMHLALDAYARLANQPSNTARLLLAGPYDAGIKQHISQPPFTELRSSNRFIAIDRYLSEDEMFLVAAASDLVLAPYPNHSGRSSIILWAAAAGKPVLTVDEGCIRYVVETQRLGTTCNIYDADAFAEAMRNAIAAPWTEEDTRRVRDYAAWHRVENYQAMCSALVRERLANQGTAP